MYYILLYIQCIIIVLLAVECWAVFRNWKGALHSYLFLACISMLVNSTGYLFELTSKTEDVYFTALRIAYLGKVWIAFSLFLFVIELVRIRLPQTLRTGLAAFNVITYIIVATTRITHLYYKNTQFYIKCRFPVFIHENGVWHHIWDFMMVIYILAGLSVLVIRWCKEKERAARESLFIVTCAILFEGVSTLAQIFKWIPVSEVYDVTMIGFYFGSALMFIAIFKFKLLDVETLTREYVIDELSEGIIAVNERGIVTFRNVPAMSLFPDLIIDPTGVVSTLKEAAETGEPLRIGDRIFSPETNKLYRNGVEIGTIYVVTDDTEHFRYMEELEKQKEIADSANAAKSRFLASMSHEIRTPINAVLGMDEIILRETTENSIRSYASDIMSAGRTLLSLINDILDLSKVEEGKMEIIPVQYEVSSLINDLCNMIRERAVRKGLKFELEADEDIPHLLNGDEVRIRQCVLNILTNAVKYTEEGSVKLRVSFEKKDNENIMLVFTVEDTGIGMKEEELEILFSPYKRFEDERNHAIEGTGLGMSITKQLLDLMGSELVVESEYGKGSRLSFSVEQEVISWTGIGGLTQRITQTKQNIPAYRELFQAPDARILVVDDTEMNLTVMQSLLKKTKIRIDTALSGKDALTLSEGNKYDVIFIDHMMPGMDGIETLSHLRESGKNQETPAIALTANAVSGARKIYLDAGFTDYISKPVEGDKLEKLLYVLLPDEKIQKPAETTAPSGSLMSGKSMILAIDDDEAVCTLIKNIMEPDYEVKECFLGSEALSMAKKYSPDLILLDIHLPDGNGFEVMRSLKDERQTADIPVLLLTGDNDSVTEENGFRSGASDYIRKPFAPDVLKQRVKRIIDLHHYQLSIEKEVERQAGRSRRLTREMMLALSKTVDTKDHYTDGHSRRVAAMSAELARRLGKSAEEQIMIYEIGLLHDIGKIGIHEDIIHKNSRLSDDEYQEIKEHTVKGYEILKEIADMPRLREGARWHHEHFDGTGYPDGLKGEDIPETARIVCVADCYDAMTSTRSYSVPRKQEDVRAEIERCKGTMFDPQVADVMLNMIDEDTEYRMNEKAKSPDVWKEYDRLWGSLGLGEIPEDDIVTEPGQTASLPEWLKDVPELDILKGVKNCGTEEGYLSVLTVFHQTAKAKADEIQELYDKKDIPDYTIKVHALKSSARIIGADKLSKLAEELETAGKEEDTDYIAGNTERLLDMYRELDGYLSKLSSVDDDLPEIDPGAMKEAYSTILEIAQSMDYGLMEDLLKELMGYRLAPADDEIIGKVEKSLTRLDWDGIIRLAEDALKN